MNRTLILFANGALVVLCCFLAARIIAAVAGEALATEETATAAAGPRAVAARRSWDDRQAILQRNLFKSELGAVAAVPEEENLPATKLNFVLLGTAAGEDPALSWAAVEDRDARRHIVVRVGDRLKDRAEVVRIERRRIVLQNGGRREELALADDQPAEARPRRAARAQRRARPTAANSPRRNPQPRRAVEQLAENRFALPRQEVESAANNPAALFSQARILPKYEDGEMVGVQLNAIKPGSIFEQIGIQDGDVITQINGIQVTGQQESAQVIRELSQSTEFDVSVVGPDGEPKELHYEVQ